MEANSSGHILHYIEDLKIHYTHNIHVFYKFFSSQKNFLCLIISELQVLQPAWQHMDPISIYRTNLVYKVYALIDHHKKRFYIKTHWHFPICKTQIYIEYVVEDEDNVLLLMMVIN